MLRATLIAGLLAVTSVPGFAADAPAPAYSSATSSIGDLLDNPEAKAVLDKYMPGFSSNSQLEMARSMTLRQIQGFAPDQIKDEVLVKIDADLTKVPAKH
jgi:para-nitrobenzyl esterase